jgi:hypothetical protein
MADQLTRSLPMAAKGLGNCELPGGAKETATLTLAVVSVACF